MKKTITLFFVVLFSIGLFAQEKTSRVRINLEGKSIQEIASLGIDVLEGNYRKGAFFETDLSASEQSKLTENGFSLTIQIEDVSAFYTERAAAEKDVNIKRNTDDEWPVPENWEYGSMGGMYTLDEILSELDDMALLYPDLISVKKPISETNLTHDGRMQYWVKISDNPETDESEPEVLYTGAHHAREGIGPHQLIFFMWTLLENYETDAEVKRIVDNTELYFVPVINVDGYEYNYETNPNGGGMWRKNRRDNLDGSYGVDPNRNYGYFWGNDDDGSSPYTSDETYRGPEAFSEPEIQNLRDFCNDHDFKIALNYHSYANLLLSPWGYTEDLPADNDLLIAFAQLMTSENGYTYGPGSTTIYPTNGGSDDWMYGEQDTKEKIFSYTPEVGNSNDGFWPAVSRIIPLCQENMFQDFTAARLVGKYAVVNDLSPTIISDIDGYFSFDITRLGLTEADSYSVNIQALDEFLVETGAPAVFQNLELLQNELDSISYMLSAGIESGQVFSYLLSVDNGDFILSDTVTKIYGTEVLVFEDDSETMENWTSPKWNTTTGEYYSPTHSITDSPSGKYQNGENNIIIHDTIIDLRGISFAFLRFWAKWEIEAGYDYAQLQAREVGTNTWQALSGKNTKTGNSYQDPGKPVYDGFVDWVQEEIDLSSFAGKEIEFRFRLISDEYVTEDGFYFDDFKVTVIDNTTGIKPADKANSFFISDAYPNPAGISFSVQYDLNQVKGNFNLILSDALGKQLINLPLNNQKGIAKVDISGFPNGIYFYRISNGSLISETKKIIKF
ncbi:MAG TPA: M14 family zinc carboxypeptidase [Bacteroidales bacterium]